MDVNRQKLRNILRGSCETVDTAWLDWVIERYPIAGNHLRSAFDVDRYIGTIPVYLAWIHPEARPMIVKRTATGKVYARKV